VYAHFLAESDRDAAATIGSVLDRGDPPKGRSKTR
jgi:hypothetical protein